MASVPAYWFSISSKVTKAVKLTRDYLCSSTANPSSLVADSTDTVPVGDSDHASCTADAHDDVETQEEVRLEDYNRDNDDEEDDVKENNVERYSLDREENPRTCQYEDNSRKDHSARKENKVIEENDEDHSGKKLQQECKYCLQQRGCKCSKACRNNQLRGKLVIPPPVDFNFLDLPIRPGERECLEYMDVGVCKDGHNCRFHHPDPVAVEGDIPSGSVPLHLSGVSQPASASLSSPLNETAPYLDVTNSCKPTLMLPHQWVHLNPGYQGEKDCTYEIHDGFCKYSRNCKLYHPDPTAVGRGDIPFSPISSHLAGASQAASTSWSSPPNETVPYVPYVDDANPYVPTPVLPPQGVPVNLEWNEYQWGRQCAYHIHDAFGDYGCNYRSHYPDPFAVGRGDIPAGLVSSHLLGALQPPSTWSSPPNVTVPYLDDANLDAPMMMLQPQSVHLNPERNGHQASLRHNGTQPLLAANPNLPGWSKPETHHAMSGTSRNGAKETKNVQSQWSEICKVGCNRKDEFDQPEVRRKNTEKPEISKKDDCLSPATATPAVKDPQVGPNESPAVDASKTVVQSMWHEICKTDCNKKDILDQNKLVKKHVRNEENLEETAKEGSAPSVKMAPAVNDPVIGSKEGRVIDTGKTVLQSAWCKICKIKCSSRVDLDQHKLGKKHKQNVEKLEESEKKDSVPPYTAALAEKATVIGPKESPAADRRKTVVQAMWHETCKSGCNNKEVSAPTVRLASAASDPLIGPRKSPVTGKVQTVMQPAWCEICKIKCTSQVDLHQHKLGKKHKQNMENLEEPEKNDSIPPTTEASASKDPVTGPKASPAANKSKIVVRSTWREICKTDCSKKDVLDQYELGKKHMVNQEKLEEAENEISAPTVGVTPAAKDPVNGQKKSPLADNGKTTLQSGWCEICKIQCTSKIDLHQHKQGKKHKNIEILEESQRKASAAKDSIGSPKEGTAAYKGKTIMQPVWREICKTKPSS